MNTLTSSPHKATRADAARNHELILCTARHLFDSEGVAHVTMSAVAEAANIGKGTLYRHFADKAQLLHALIDSEAQALRAQTDERLGRHECARENLHWFIDQALDFSHRNSAMLCEATHHAPSATLNHPARLWWRDVLTELFRQRQSAVAPAYAAAMLFMMLDSHTLYHQQAHMGFTLDAIRANLHLVIDQLLGNGH
jgi:AcrR family transcriptional regulator